MGELASRLAEMSVITSDNPRTEDPEEILSEVLRGVPASRQHTCFAEVEPRGRHS